MVGVHLQSMLDPLFAVHAGTAPTLFHLGVVVGARIKADLAIKLHFSVSSLLFHSN